MKEKILKMLRFTSGIAIIIIFVLFLQWYTIHLLDNSYYDEMSAKCEKFKSLPVGEMSFECARFFNI